MEPLLQCGWFVVAHSEQRCSSELSMALWAASFHQKHSTALSGTKMLLAWVSVNTSCNAKCECMRDQWFLVGYLEQLLVEDLDFHLVLADVVSAAYLQLSSWQLVCLLCLYMCYSMGSVGHSVLSRACCSGVLNLVAWAATKAALPSAFWWQKSSLLLWNTHRFVLGFDNPE